jgi:lysophospholipase L1-like esterase
MTEPIATLTDEGWECSALLPGQMPYARRQSYCLLGDSVMSRHVIQTTASLAFSADGPVNWLMAKMGHPLLFLNNAAVGGYTTAEALAVIESGVIAYKPGFCFFNGGWNDIAALVPTDEIIRNLKNIARRLLQAGILPIYQGLHSSTAYSSVASKNAINKINREIRQFLHRYGGKFIETYSQTLDTSTGGSLANVTRDGLHLTAFGAKLIGEGPYFDELQDILLPCKPVCSTNDYGVIHGNPLMLGNNATGAGGFTRTGFSSGNGPDGWTADVSNATGTLTNPAARTDGRAGQKCVMNITASANEGWGRFYHAIRWDTAWTAAAAVTRAIWRIPTVPNGFMYNAAVGGTTGGTEPTWPTVEGNTVVDNTVTWRAYRMPVEGEEYMAEFEFSGCSIATAGGLISPMVIMQNTGGSTLAVGYGNYYDPGSGGDLNVYPTTIEAAQFYRTPPLAIPEGCKVIIMSMRAQGANTAALTIGCNNALLYPYDAE